MRYFTYDLIAAANDWIEQSDAEERAAVKRLETVFKRYLRHLDALEHRVSRPAWQFFRYGFASESLHDARLLTLRVGDGLNYTPDGSAPFLLNRQPARAVFEFLNYEQDLHYLFDLRGVSRGTSDLIVDQSLAAKSFGDLYTYELTKAAAGRLRLGFLFASGGSIVVKFKKLVFRKRRLDRKYEIGEMYR
jgi:hypothetical protein